MYYEIINPSDMTTLKTDDPKVAMATTILLGSGKYGLQDENGNNEYPIIMMFMTDQQTKERCQEIFDMEIMDYIKANELMIIEALDSVAYFSIKERHTYDKAMEAIDDPAKKKAFKLEIAEKNRSSMNNICGRARDYAELMRKKMEGPE